MIKVYLYLFLFIFNLLNEPLYRIIVSLFSLRLFSQQEFRYRRGGVDLLFIEKSTTDENAWAPTGDEPLPNEGPTGDEVERKTHSEFMELFNTTIVSDSLR